MAITVAQHTTQTVDGKPVSQPEEILHVELRVELYCTYMYN